MTNFPENTLVGIEAALKAGAQFVEFDTQLLSSGEFIVHHDDNCLRTSAVDLDIFDQSIESIKNISVHQPDIFDKQFDPTPISTLQEVLAAFKPYPNACAVVEIKTESIVQWGRERVVEKLLSQLKASNTKVMVISFDAEAIFLVKKSACFPVGWVLKKYDESSLACAKELQPDVLICNHCKLIENQPPWSGPWQWMLYDIVDLSLAQAYAHQGVKMIETADISLMLKHD